MSSADFVSSYIDAWNHHDAGGVAEHLTQDGTYCDIVIQQQLTRDRFIEHLKDYFARDTNLYELVGEVATGKNSIAFQYRSYPSESCHEQNTLTGAEFLTMDGHTAGRIDDYYQNPVPVAENKTVGGAVSKAAIQRYAKSGLDKAGLQALMCELTELMDGEQLYLLSDLTMPQLATRLGCSINHLSQAINAGFGIGFFDFINQYRVQDAKGMLGQNDARTPAILNIALAVGFNSTSTFYAAFKKATGHTPAQYRRAQVEFR